MNELSLGIPNGIRQLEVVPLKPEKPTICSLKKYSVQAV